MYATCLFLQHGDYAWAILLVFTFVITGLRFGRHWPWEVLVEARRSWARGLRTSEFCSLIWADLGVHALPALLLKLRSLPLATKEKGAISALIAAVGIFGVIIPTALFIFEYYDLGIEQEGFESASIPEGTKSSEVDSHSQASDLPILPAISGPWDSAVSVVIEKEGSKRTSTEADCPPAVDLPVTRKVNDQSDRRPAASMTETCRMEHSSWNELTWKCLPRFCGRFF